MIQLLFLVPVIGGRWYIITQVANIFIYNNISGIYCQLGDYMLLTSHYGNQETPLRMWWIELGLVFFWNAHEIWWKSILTNGVPWEPTIFILCGFYLNFKALNTFIFWFWGPKVFTIYIPPLQWFISWLSYGSITGTETMPHTWMA